MQRLFSVALALLVMAFASISHANEAAIVGVWRAANQSHVAISACPAGYCGRIVKVRIAPKLYEENKAAIDAVGMDNLPDYFNKDPALRGRLLKGLQILTFKPTGEEGLYEGELYNAEDGNTYSGKMEQTGQNGLRLSGCVFFNLLCQSEDWVRVK